jgi:iron complex outermembrane receptor protein
MLALLLMLWPASALAQLGPRLRPPALAPDEAIDAIEKTETSKGPESSNLLAGEWQLNAETVVFSAAKKRQLIAEAPSTIHVITDRQINRYGWRSLAEILRMVPGVQTRTWLAQYDSLMIRGLLGSEVNGTRILWLDNGVPMNDVRDGGIWLDQTFPTELIKRIEVILGPGSSLYGAGAFQGVINIFSKDPKDVAEYGEYRVGVGSDATLRSSALAGVQLGPLGMLFFASANRSDGPGLLSAYRLRQLEREAGAEAVRNGVSPLSTVFDPKAPAVNSGRVWQNLYFKALLDPVRLSVGFRNIEAGFDGAEFFVAERYRFNRREFSSEIVFEEAFSDAFSLTALLSYRFNQNDYVDYFDLDLDTVVAIDNDSELVNHPLYPSRLDEKVTFVTDQHRVFSLAQLQWQLFSSNELIAGVGGRFEAIDAPDFRTDKVSQSFLNGSVFLQDEQRFLDGDIIITGGARFDTHREFGPQFSFRAAVLVKWTRWMLNRFSYGTAFKEPSMSQLYIDQFNTVGNPNLDPETLHNLELSTVLRPVDQLTIRVDAFLTLMDNLIFNRFNSKLAVPYLGIDGKFESTQEAAARIFGLELSARAELIEGLSLFVHYNFLDSRAQRSQDESFEPIDYDASHRAGLGVAWSSELFSASLASFFVGPSIDVEPSAPGEDVSGSRRDVDPYVVLQPNFRVRLPADFSASLQASYALSEGLTEVPTNTTYYQMLGVPVPRLSFLFALSYPYYE